MKSIKVMGLIFTPQVIICYLMIAIIIFLQFSRPVDTHTHLEVDKDGVVREYSNEQDDEYYNTEYKGNGAYDTHRLTWQDMKEYQLSITQDFKYVIMWDYDRMVGVLPLDNNCNLTNLIQLDNE